MNGSNISILVVIGVVLLFILFATIIRRYRRCPSDKILVVYGKTGGGSAKCIHGGGKFVWPVIQDYAYLSLTPISIDANLTNALSRQNIRVDQRRSTGSADRQSAARRERSLRWGCCKTPSES